jgi:hypothetical protein
LSGVELTARQPSREADQLAAGFGFRRSTFLITFPAFRQEVQTVIRLGTPFTNTRTR